MLDSKLHRLTIASPYEISREKRRLFRDLLWESETVVRNGSTRRIRSAKILAFYEVDNKLVGIGAIKSPDKTYIERLGILVDRKLPTEELGWFYVNPKHRGKGIATEIVHTLLPSLRSGFSTVCAENLSMQNILGKAGFSWLDKTFNGRENEFMVFLKENK